ncbi:MAG: DUF1501 domain-containing protein [Acidobacteria bacterium]|nr:DUF1501 domain-containing protein [Acidobacteriota bacterium]
MRNFMDTMLTRREAFRRGAVSVGGYWFLPLAGATARAATKTQPRGTARFCVFFMLDGGQSHVDAWDLKEHAWTPQDFAIRELRPGVKWPTSLYPKLGAQLDRFALLRSVEAWDSVHGRAQYYVQAAHPFNPALAREVPPIGSVAALELTPQRRETDTLPPYVALNVTQSQAGLLGQGFLPATYAPFHIDTAASLSAYSIREAEKREFERRWQLLRGFDARLRSDPAVEAKAYRDYHSHYEGAVRLMSDPRAAKLFEAGAEEKARYGNTATGEAAIIARNLIEADAGTRFIFLQQNGWDHHKDIYEPKNHYKLSRDLDAALGSFLEDLATRKRPGGGSLLDETLVVCMGEFGRTPGALTQGLKGRDHYQYAFTVLMAGGGVKGGRVIGRTDEMGAKVVDAGWGVKRSIYMEDIATTVYSALGIDWGKSVKATPSGREFYYVESVAAQAIQPNREVSVVFS